MTGRRRVLATVAGVAIVALATVAPATTAVADPAITVSVNASVDGGQATVSGSATMSSVLGLDPVTGVHITVRSRQNPAITAGCDGCGAALDGRNQVDFSMTTAELAYNGPYDVAAEVSGKKTLGSTVRTTETTSFNIEVDPAPPADVTATVNPDRTVTVSWARNTEPDLVGYQVQRRTGSSDFQPGPRVDQADGSRVQWIDSSTVQAAGAVDYQYRVVAVRPDGDGEVSVRAISISTPAKATVPAPPPGAPGSPGAPGGPGAAPGGPGGPGAAPGGPGPLVVAGGGAPFTTGAPASLDVGSFLTAGGAPPGIAVPGGVALPDGTFSATLPFGPKKDAASLGDDSVEILDQSTSRRTLFLPVAAGLLLCMLAMHLRRFNHRVLAPPVEPRPPVEPGPPVEP